jgi:hypothetical protein
MTGFASGSHVQSTPPGKRRSPRIPKLPDVPTRSNGGGVRSPRAQTNSLRYNFVLRIVKAERNLSSAIFCTARNRCVWRYRIRAAHAACLNARHIDPRRGQTIR